ncbi:hypothetical protein [Paenibacillus sp. J31TS4]|uniref:hypothetical protein n=1 Tax=Paenibacillus sp. J31TS4 TaxID=2807195 RepID=UPI001BCD991F|nr:hypothetical protein [Paenibacillus sp. J31TS4]
MRTELSGLWNEWYREKQKWVLHPPVYQETAVKFVRGYSLKSRLRNDQWLPVPADCRAGVVLNVNDGLRHGYSILRQLHRLLLQEDIVVIAHELPERQLLQLRKDKSSPVIIHFPNQLGPDVGRAIGAKASPADKLLFLEDKVRITAEELLPFFLELEKGTDVVLNDASSFLPLFQQRHPEWVVQEFLNLGLGRPDLKANSLVNVPHALSRHAVESIGYSALAVPAKAHGRALQLPLKIAAPGKVKIVSSARTASSRKASLSHDSLFQGDSIEALAEALQRNGDRLNYEDQLRKRDFVGG